LDDQLTCVFIIDEKHNLLFASRTASDSDCWHQAFRIEDNRLLGLNGISDFTFRSKVLTGLSKRTSVLLKTSESHQEGSQLLLTVTPLFDVKHSPNQSNPPCYCLEIQSLDTLYETTVKRMTEKFNLTKAESLVLKCLLMGLSSQEIEARMMIGTPTLRTHQQRLRQKIGENSSVKTILSALKTENHVDHIIDIEEF
jgi:DNA-binding CsgD family transcriptional regulator